MPSWPPPPAAAGFYLYRHDENSAPIVAHYSGRWRRHLRDKMTLDQPMFWAMLPALQSWRGGVEAQPSVAPADYVVLGQHGAAGFDASRPDPLGALIEICAFLSKPERITDGEIVYSTAYYGQIEAMAQRAVLLGQLHVDRRRAEQANRAMAANREGATA